MKISVVVEREIDVNSLKGVGVEALELDSRITGVLERESVAFFGLMNMSRSDALRQSWLGPKRIISIESAITKLLRDRGILAEGEQFVFGRGPAR